MSAARRSALIIPVAAAEPHVGAIRRAHDPAARCGIPAHITLLFPFLPTPRLQRLTRTALAGVFAATPSFSFQLAQPARFPNTLYLAPDPAAPFIALIQMLMRGWPEAPPYGGAFAEIVPHLTVAQGPAASADVLMQILLAASPIPAVAREAWLMLEDTNGRWWRDQVYPLA